LTINGPFGDFGGEAVMPPVVGEHLAAVRPGLLRPHVEPHHERLGLETLLERWRDGLQVERLGLNLRHAKEDADVGRTQRILQSLRHPVGRFLTQLA
jgi:hypothetical protein